MSPVSRTGPARVLIAAADPLVRRALQSVLSEPDFELVAETASADEALAITKERSPHVALVDVILEEGDGLEIAERIAREAGETRVIVLAATDDEDKALRALRAGARGYLIKDVLSDEITDAIRRVHGGGQCIPPSVAEQLAGRLAKAALSSREIDVLKLIAEGLSTKEVATRLGVADTTAKKHTAGVLSKLGAKDRTHAVRLALERGIITLET